jgi:pimeloyl-ACP methyl ester carboxylesterase
VNAVAVTTGRVATEGDELYYEVRGEGPALLMISGGIGDAGHYSLVGDILSDQYRVIAYDRRGNSRSTRRDPQNVEIGQQARDAMAVLRAAGHESAYVFGNSGGAVIGLELARSHPAAVEALVAHEPPVLRVLPDAHEWMARFAQLHLTAWGGDPDKAVADFLATTAIPPSVYEHMSADFVARIAGNREFFIRSELIPFSSYSPDTAAIAQNGVKVVMAAGQATLDAAAYYGLTAPIVAERLGCDMVPFPGHHLSYMDMPADWAATLRTVFETLAAD